MRRWFVVLLLLALPLPAFGAEGRSRLAPGDSLFWNGPHVEDGEGFEGWTTSFEVARGGFRLRIGFDHPQPDDSWSVSITDPSGDTSPFQHAGGLYSFEFARLRPEAGTWTVEVNPNTVTDSNFRVRAKLEAREPSLGVKRGPVLPNLQVLPPHDASFLMPVTNGSTAEQSVGLDLMGAESCHPEEHAEEQALRCLRFGFGIRNTGRGPLQLFNSGVAVQDQELVQRIELAQGGFIERSAGTARYHKTHGHYHHHDAVGLRLFKVTDRKKGTVEPAGEMHRKGFAHRNELLREWTEFYPTWTPAGFGLNAGWADIYEWDRPGNYIDFGLNGDGYYLVRMWADPVRGVMESNEKDNTGYTYLKVTGSTVELLEAGRGRDPWDPCKIEVGFGGARDPAPSRRPSHCPPDTV